MCCFQYISPYLIPKGAGVQTHEEHILHSLFTLWLLCKSIHRYNKLKERKVCVTEMREERDYFWYNRDRWQFPWAKINAAKIKKSICTIRSKPSYLSLGALTQDHTFILDHHDSASW